MILEGLPPLSTRVLLGRRRARSKGVVVGAPPRSTSGQVSITKQAASASACASASIIASMKSSPALYDERTIGPLATYRKPIASPCSRYHANAAGVTYLPRGRVNGVCE